MVTKKSSGIVMPTQEEMRARFNELKPQLEACDEELAPLQKVQADIANYRRDEEIETNLAIKEVNSRRAAISDEMSVIVRALGGQTTDPAERAAAAAKKTNE